MDKTEKVKREAIKNDGNKADLTLIPYESLCAVARVMKYGGDKYGRDNWLLGTRWSRYSAAALRHIHSWFEGEDFDVGSGQSHLAHAICCLMFMYEYQYYGIGKDDRRKRLGG